LRHGKGTPGKRQGWLKEECNRRAGGLDITR
jgi:hypothetical protein